jgi:hypothetical protein
MARKQSAFDRSQRIERGCCPIHGIWMPQAANWADRIGGALDGAHVTIVKCPRRDCGIRAYAASFDGPWELLPEYQHLLAGG